MPQALDELLVLQVRGPGVQQLAQAMEESTCHRAAPVKWVFDAGISWHHKQALNIDRAT
jgi:hypothetical protein